MTVKVSIGQIGSSVNVDRNLAQAEDEIRAGARSGADLIVLPENSMYQNPDKSANAETYSEHLDGPFVTQVAKAAQENSIAVVIGVSETIPEDSRHYNTLVYIDSAGRMGDTYRKTHMYDAFGYTESDKVRPAATADPLSFTIGDMNFTGITCYDIRFPELSAYAVNDNVDCLIIPAAWTRGPLKEFHWDTLLRSRAVENTCYVVGAGQADAEHIGQSMIIDPMGLTAASVGERSPHTESARIEKERVASVRRTNPCLKNRRLKVSAA